MQRNKRTHQPVVGARFIAPTTRFIGRDSEIVLSTDMEYVRISPDKSGVGAINRAPTTSPFCGLVLLVLLFLFSSSPASAHTLAGRNGRIFGQLVNGTENNAPIVGQTVTLQIAQGNNSQDLATATTDAKGNYSFPNLTTDKTINYAVYMLYQGAQYTSNLTTLDSNPVQQLNLTTYDATSSSAKIAVIQATVLIHEPDSTKGSITVSEVYFFTNLDTRAYVGSLDASKGKPNALFFPLVPHARNVALATGFDGYHVLQVDRGFASDAAVPPGNSQFAFSYQIPYSSSTYDFAYTAFYPTVHLTMLVAPILQVTAPGLTSNGVVTAEQSTYRSFQAAKLLANQAIHVQLAGLTTSTSTLAASLPTTTSTTWLIVVFLLMGAILLGTWLVYRSRHRPTTRRGSTSRNQRTQATNKNAKPVQDGASPKKATFSETTAVSKTQQQALLQELLDLDKAFEAGKLSKSVYQERRAKTKTRLRNIMSEEEATKR